MKLINDTYIVYHKSILLYINNRVNNMEISADLCQDVFLRIIEHADMLREKTIKSFMFTIAKNIIIDYNRHNSRYVDLKSYIYDIDHATTIYPTDTSAIVSDLKRVEKNIIDKFPSVRRDIYCMYHHDGMTPMEISKALNMNRHIVYDHLFLGKKIVREHFRQICI